MKITMGEYWRAWDGVVSHDDVFSFDDEKDGRRLNVDHLFENEADAKAEAIEFLKEKITMYQARLDKLT